MPIILAIDPSLTSTAVCLLDTTDWRAASTTITSKPNGKDIASRIRRYEGIATRVLAEIVGAQPSLVLIEGYSFGSKGAAVVTLGEFGGVLRYRLTSGTDKRIIEVAPTVLKKFVTGSGRADKTAMITNIVQRWGATFKTDDEYDAYGLCRLGVCVLGLDSEATRAQREVAETLTKESNPC